MAILGSPVTWKRIRKRWRHMPQQERTRFSESWWPIALNYQDDLDPQRRLNVLKDADLWSPQPGDAALLESWPARGLMLPRARLETSGIEASNLQLADLPGCRPLVA